MKKFLFIVLLILCFIPSISALYNTTTTLVLWNNSTHSTSWVNPYTQYNGTSFGITGDIPFLTDWYKNGTYTFGVYRPSTGYIYIDLDQTGSYNATYDYNRNTGVIGANIVLPVFVANFTTPKPTPALTPISAITQTPIDNLFNPFRYEPYLILSMLFFVLGLYYREKFFNLFGCISAIISGLFLVTTYGVITGTILDFITIIICLLIAVNGILTVMKK